MASPGRARRAAARRAQVKLEEVEDEASFPRACAVGDSQWEPDAADSDTATRRGKRTSPKAKPRAKTKPKVVTKRTRKATVTHAPAKRVKKATDSSKAGGGKSSSTKTPTQKPRAKSSRSKKMQSSLPIYLPRTASASKNTMLLQLNDSKVDLSGDTGVVGRMQVDDVEVLLDIKGNVYKGALSGTPSLLIVAIGNEEAKIESISNGLLRMDYQHNVRDAETLVGVLDESKFVDLDEDLNIAWQEDKAEERKTLKKKRKRKGKS